jgi:hypothetical protein
MAYLLLMAEKVCCMLRVGMLIVTPHGAHHVSYVQQLA